MPDGDAPLAVCVVCGWQEETARERESGSVVCDDCYERGSQ